MQKQTRMVVMSSVRAMVFRWREKWSLKGCVL